MPGARKNTSHVLDNLDCLRLKKSHARLLAILLGFRNNAKRNSSGIIEEKTDILCPETHPRILSDRRFTSGLMGKNPSEENHDPDNFNAGDAGVVLVGMCDV